jgi:hypothetical protein
MTGKRLLLQKPATDGRSFCFAAILVAGPQPTFLTDYGTGRKPQRRFSLLEKLCHGTF